MKILKMKDVIASNPQVDAKQVREVLDTLRELRKNGITRASYSLVSPYGRRVSPSADSKPDPRAVKLRVCR
jgi:hypothetical protein